MSAEIRKQLGDRAENNTAVTSVNLWSVKVYRPNAAILCHCATAPLSQILALVTDVLRNSGTNFSFPALFRFHAMINDLKPYGTNRR